ncbi:universal stress protein [Dokdonella immobilis]|uniref:Nucleotide-binding universal stress protein, UspA family n=1 Tax=Dokdonella immobilis TaxID=578942 RepID=A0A1I4ZA49_9GAMM|nr:universal stress protein [Dokdonella immobilis]SFN47068.1 Nucleotide-binding universal stress protein, UspA family [Dokdonella immobilis]
MSDPSWTQGPPKTILLATDLSNRCDRATDRAAHLAKLWGARLVVLNVLEFDQEFLESRRTADLPSWRQPPDREGVVLAQLRRDLREDLKGVEIRIVQGAPAATIDAVARDIDADLIIVGLARDESLGRYFLGSTVERLSRQTPIPLLVVKNRVRPYGEILVATDFSPPSQHALTAAAQFFPQAPLTLLHAWEVPFKGLLDSPNFRREWTAMEKVGCDKFVAQSRLSPDQHRSLQVLLEHGSTESIICTYMRDKGVELIVVGTHGRSGLFDVRLGGTAKRILEAAPGDVLLIREPRSVRAPGANSTSKESAAVD